MKKYILLATLLLATGCGLGAVPLVEPSRNLAPPLLRPVQTAPLTQAQQAALLADEQGIVLSVVDFAERMFVDMLGEPETNQVFSPLSLYYALAMAGLGAGGETYAAFEQVLGASPVQHVDILGALARYLTHHIGDATTLNIANAAWIDSWAGIDPQVRAKLVTYWGAQVVDSDDFRNPATVDNINQWVSDQTNAQIPDFLPYIDTDAEETLLLINALYFLGSWVEPLIESQRAFYLSSEGADAGGYTDFLSTDIAYRSAVVTDSFQAVSLPYRGHAVALMLMMPTDGTPVREAIASGNMAFSQARASADWHSTHVHFPAFEVSHELELTEQLRATPLDIAFDRDHADLWQLFDEPTQQAAIRPPHITRVMQQVVVDMNRYGTEASAATVVAVAMPSSGLDTTNLLELVFDRPFVYVIYHRETGVPLFMGVMDDPMNFTS